MPVSMPQVKRGRSKNPHDEPRKTALRSRSAGADFPTSHLSFPAYCCLKLRDRQYMSHYSSGGGAPPGAQHPMQYPLHMLIPPPQGYSYGGTGAGAGPGGFAFGAGGAAAAAEEAARRGAPPDVIAMALANLRQRRRGPPGPAGAAAGGPAHDHRHPHAHGAAAAAPARRGGRISIRISTRTLLQMLVFAVVLYQVSSWWASEALITQATCKISIAS